MQKSACVIDLIDNNKDMQIIYTSPHSPNLLANESNLNFSNYIELFLNRILEQSKKIACKNIF